MCLARRGMWVLVFLILVGPGMPLRSLAQDPGKNAVTPPAKHLAESAPPTTGPILGSGALPMGKGNAGLQPYWYLSFRGGKFSNTGKVVSAGQDKISLQNALELYYGITDNFWVSVFWFYYVYNWVSDIEHPGPGQGRSARLGGSGPLSLTFRYLFFQEQKRRPTITGLFTLGFPTNRGASLTPGTLPAEVSGSRAWGFTFGLNLYKYARPVKLYINLWYFIATKDKTPTDTDGTIALESFNDRDRIKFNLALEYPWRGKGPWVLLLEMSSFFEVGPIFRPAPRSKPAILVTGLVGIEYILSPGWRFTLGCSVDLFGKNSPINYTPVFTIYKPLDFFRKRRPRRPPG